MTFNNDQLRSFHLAGMVGIPSPFPELGILSVVEGVLGAGDQQQTWALSFLRIEHRQSPRLLIARSVLSTDVAGIFCPDDHEHNDVLKGTWHLGSEAIRAFVELLKRGPDGSRRGIVYVPRDARVLMQVEIGMTAAESAAYYPPITNDTSERESPL